MINRAHRFLKNLSSVATHPIHRDRPVLALRRHLRTLAASVLSPTQTITVPYVGGAVLQWPREAGSVMLCARYGLGEYADMAFALHFLRPEDLFVDVGANAGVYTILAARAVGCRVVAAEPVPATFDLLMQNVYANHVAARVEARQAGIGRAPALLNFTSALWSYNHVVAQPAEDTVEVEVLPLDAVLAGRSPAMLKIDVEGFEAEVIAGASRTLADPALKSVLIEMYAGHVSKYGGTLADIESQLRHAGFEGPYWYDPALRSFIKPGDQEATKYNQLFVRDREFITHRLAHAPAYEVHGTLV